MQAPEIKYEFFIKDAHADWCIHDDSINITETTSESGVVVVGVKADAMFMMCRNALACKREYSVFHELSNKPYNIKAAKEMIAALQSYVDDNTKDANNNNTEESK